LQAGHGARVVFRDALPKKVFIAELAACEREGSIAGFGVVGYRFGIAILHGVGLLVPGSELGAGPGIARVATLGEICGGQFWIGVTEAPSGKAQDREQNQGSKDLPNRVSKPFRSGFMRRAGCGVGIWFAHRIGVCGGRLHRGGVNASRGGGVLGSARRGRQDGRPGWDSAGGLRDFARVRAREETPKYGASSRLALAGPGRACGTEDPQQLSKLFLLGSERDGWFRAGDRDLRRGEVFGFLAGVVFQIGTGDEVLRLGRLLGLFYRVPGHVQGHFGGRRLYRLFWRLGWVSARVLAEPEMEIVRLFGPSSTAMWASAPTETVGGSTRLMGSSAAA